MEKVEKIEEIKVEDMLEYEKQTNNSFWDGLPDVSSQGVLAMIITGKKVGELGLKDLKETISRYTHTLEEIQK